MPRTMPIGVRWRSRGSMAALLAEPYVRVPSDGFGSASVAPIKNQKVRW